MTSVPTSLPDAVPLLLSKSQCTPRHNRLDAVWFAAEEKLVNVRVDPAGTSGSSVPTVKVVLSVKI